MIEAGRYTAGSMVCASATSTGKKFDAGKLRYSLMPQGVVEAVLTVLEYGASKYGANNWQGLPEFDDRYYNALMRHLHAYRAGEQCDAESGLPHMAHAACNVLFLLWQSQQQQQALQGKPPAPDFT